MDWTITKDERLYLRDLAKRQAEIAALPIMEQRKKMWFDLNDGVQGAKPPFIVETWTFNRDFLPDAILKCKSDEARKIEKAMLGHIRRHEIINDDTVIPDFFDMIPFIEFNEFGFPIKRESVKDRDGIETGFRTIHPITDLEKQLHTLKPAECRYDKATTESRRQFLDGLLGDILPIKMKHWGLSGTFLTSRVIDLMGMEKYFSAMIDCPDAVHALMAYLRDNALRMMRWLETEGLLRINNRHEHSFGSSANFTNRLPAPGFDGNHVRLCDIWAGANSQETVGVSPRMFHTFCFPYYRDVVEPIGLLYFGCCEPAHPFWKDIKEFPHLKKVSISRWCDQKFMADQLRGTEIVFSRKPDPNFLSVDETLNEPAWAAHIRETLELTRGVFVEFIVRDVYTLHGNLNNAKRCVEIARQEIDAFFPVA